MHFDKDEYQRLQENFGPLTLEACATCYNNLCPNYCSKETPFLNHQLQGETVFLCPMMGSEVMPMLQYFEAQRLQSPLDTRANVILLVVEDQWDKKAKEIINKYQLVHQYPAGTYLLEVANLVDEIQDVPNPTLWPVNVFLADHTIEDRKSQSE